MIHLNIKVSLYKSKSQLQIKMLKVKKCRLLQLTG